MPNRFESQVVPAALVLADGSVFPGRSIGAPGTATGEVVFHTGMTGYQEILTDPSYCRQLVTLTYPHIGNVGCNAEDMESGGMQAEGLIIKSLAATVSNWRSQGTLTDFLVREGKPAMADIDTRQLTRLLRDKGAQNGCLVAGASPNDTLDIDGALARAREFPGLAGLDLARVVSTGQQYPWQQGAWHLDGGHPRVAPALGSGNGRERPFKVVAYDFGIKRNILRLLADSGCDLTVVPAQFPADQALAMQPDGIFLSNGPGDPEPCEYAIAAARVFIERGLPIFGICLGHQILALAAGGRTMKMKFGHHGANHPVQDLTTGQVLITSQNHGFAVDPDSLPGHVRVTHRSLFDQSIQGIELADRPVFGFQGHPEASPGPHDVADLFRRFVERMAAARDARAA